MSKTIHIAYPHGGIIPAAVLGAKEDKKLNAHEPFEVPAAYGRSLIDDRFAYEAEIEKKMGKSKKAAIGGATAAELATLEEAVDAAKVKLAGADMVDKAVAQGELDTAEHALAAAIKA